MEKDLLGELQTKIGVTFTDDKLLDIAFTHPSVHGKSHLTGTESYQRLEFVGDAVIRLVASREVYEKSNGKVESLHNSREGIVLNIVLAKVANDLNLGRYLVGSGSKDVLTSQLVLAKIYESLTGAIFLDKDFETAANFVLRTLITKT